MRPNPNIEYSFNIMDNTRENVKTLLKACILIAAFLLAYLLGL